MYIVTAVFEIFSFSYFKQLKKSKQQTSVTSSIYLKKENKSEMIIKLNCKFKMHYTETRNDLISLSICRRTHVIYF